MAYMQEVYNFHRASIISPAGTKKRFDMIWYYIVYKRMEIVVRLSSDIMSLKLSEVRASWNGDEIDSV